MSDSPESLMQAVHEVASLTGKTALAHYRRDIGVDFKTDGSPVTIADREGERAARTWIQDRFPNDGILGEEFGETPGTSGRRWILDPIDGTKSFVRGVPLWGSLVAVMEGETVLAGAACYPATEEIISAAPGCGAWYNGSRARVSAVADVARATLLVTDERTVGMSLSVNRWNDLSAKVAVLRSWGDCFGYLLVATGRAEVMVDPVVNAWDAACFLPIIEEAGGVITDLRGSVTALGGHAIATNAALAETVRAALGIPAISR